MSSSADTQPPNAPSSAMIGPGRLVLVVGPSGAGKDTLINGAKLECAGDSAVVFPRRAITRPPSAFEDHDTMERAAFDQAAAARAFAFSWDAHGNRYGIPASIEDDIRRGRTVVCNVSRSIVDVARRRYALIAVVLVTAPQQILEARLASRARESDGSLARRTLRPGEIDDLFGPELVIRNVGPPEAGVRLLLDLIRPSASAKAP
jgi:ribose 1,5-bisphosphokinase